MTFAIVTQTARRRQLPPHNRATPALAGQLRLLVCLLLLSIPCVAETAAPVSIRQCLQYVVPQSAQPHNQVTLDDLEAFYRSRDYRPLWNRARRTRQLEQAFADLAADGLSPEHYSIPGVIADTRTSPLLGEIATTRAWLQALFHLHFGVLDREDTEPLWHHQDTDFSLQRSQLLDLALANADNPAAAFAQARVNLSAYTVLRATYRQLAAEHSSAPPWPVVPPGPVLRPGMHDARVVALRRRLRAGGYSLARSGTPEYYDETLQRAVTTFQYRHSLAEDGLVGQQTRRALNISRTERLQQLRANLERWRWLARELEPEMVIVDIAGAKIRYYRDGKQWWQARAVVGTARRKTPSLHSAITHFTFNPSWTVPPTILRQDKLPAIRSDLEYLDRQGLRVLDQEGQLLDPYQIDWEDPGAIILRQGPGSDNPLGVVAIRFPNPFAVYLHDTPQKYLFQRSRRTHSSGCVRVEDVLTLIEALLDSAGDCSPEAIASIIDAGKTRWVALASPIPLLMDYWTATVDEDSQLRLRTDHYRRDRALARALEQPDAAPELLFCSISD